MTFWLTPKNITVTSTGQLNFRSWNEGIICFGILFVQMESTNNEFHDSARQIFL
ncbi:MAG: hypothetical protein HY541_08685 [Deltaproteobacteria bacterium]|nr:hypothetical protein [Deltaproteobacteria bacterium]